MRIGRRLPAAARVVVVSLGIATVLVLGPINVVAPILGAWSRFVGPRDVVELVLLFVFGVYCVFFLRHFALAASASVSFGPALSEPIGDVSTMPAVTVLVPCHNEAMVVGRTVAALARLSYPKDRLQIIFIDDASSDDTGLLLESATTGVAGMSVLHRRREDGEHGKSAALNAALQLVTGDVVVVFDADHQPFENVLEQLVGPFRDPSVALAQGRCVINNPDASAISAAVALDYLSGYIVNMQGRAHVLGLAAYGGSNCAVRTSVLLDLGGWNPASVTEDTDLTLRAVLAGHEVAYVPAAVDLEEGVTTLSAYWRQRYRWARGHQEACRHYLWPAVRSRHVRGWRRVELIAFLLVFHLPVLGALALALTPLVLLGIITVPGNSATTAILPLLLFGPLVELAVALVVARVPKRALRHVPVLIPLFILGIFICTKAWIDGLRRQPYEWDKTDRSGAGAVAGDLAPKTASAPSASIADSGSVPEGGGSWIRPIVVARRYAVVRGALALAVVGVGYWFGINRVRGFEANASGWAADRLGSGTIRSLQGAGILVLPGNHAAFVARLTAPCSSLPGVLAVLSVAIILPGLGLRRVRSALLAAAIVIAANLARVTVCLLLGVTGGIRWLTLFHDSVGVLFGLVSAVGGAALLVAWSSREHQKSPPASVLHAFVPQQRMST